ncbi:MAG: ATP-dependent zinc metalloprotease FtsH [Eubacteriales bacterium]|nr:ATP-dependent zinc metalloprotease FtsH [Eubacteriales bacterium]
MDNNFNPFNGGSNGQGSGNGSGGQNGGPGQNPRRTSLILLAIAAVVTLVSMSLFMRMINNATNQEISYGKFQEMVENGRVQEVTWDDETIYITPKPTETEQSLSLFAGGAPNVTYYTGKAQSDDALSEYLKANNVESYGKEVPDNSGFLLTLLLYYVVPIGLMWILLSLLFRRMGGSGGPMGVGKSNAKVYVQKETGVTFRDVAGEDEAKESLQEVVDFLHNPQRYVKIGAKLPKGALLVGPPGTGKTLLAKAVAGEAKVPFFSLTGSDFIELYVGVGASRVRDLFKEATKNAPCIIFIDEIDAIGRSRDSKFGGGNEEREQTLNQLLSEMDGFDTSKGILVLGATNRPEILDKALLRPGRFDRRIIVDKPDLKGRVEILRVHAKDVKMDETVDFDAIALATSGAVGSDLANMINEAAINAVKEGREYVCQKDLFEAVEQVLVGKEKKDRIMSAQERRIVSYHEVGHALIAALQKNSEPVQKITIVPRTMGALGYVMHVPEEEKYLNTQAEIHDMLVGYLGGRAAEEIVFDTVTTGAANDIEQATTLARSMVTRFGMSKKFGLIGLETVESQYLDGRSVLNCSDATAAEIDQEVMRILKECYSEAVSLLSENREVMDKLAAYLIEKETITGREFMRIYREIKGLPQEPAQDAAKDSADALAEDTRKAQRDVETARNEKPWESFARQREQDRQQSQERQQNQDRQSSTDSKEQGDSQEKPWTPPAPGPEAQGPVGRFSGSALPKDEEK